MKLLVTGGAGFIGSHFIRYVLEAYPDDSVVNLDKLTYAGNLDNLRDVDENERYRFLHGDICDPKAVEKAAEGCEAIVNFAAETHVDRSIVAAGSFLRTDVLGAHVLLEEARRRGMERFVQVSTDEVYGSIERGSAKETDCLRPSSPYSASKAGGDLQVLAAVKTYGTPALITRGSNTYGPFQYPEKLIPLFVTNGIEGKKLPLYGQGANVRDWVHVSDHCRGIDTVLRNGRPGEVYNIGAGNERRNKEVALRILSEIGLGEDSIEYVKDRPGHDLRYSVDGSKLQALGWRPETPFEEGLRSTIRWYRDNEWWWRKIKRGEGDFADWERRWYVERGL
ncbi:MAG: dTDP-glucose 4,6-dehydratase [Actinobacteria bacterium]|nr:MAG: dTDP-glucose 4,6-dehydratase [Actinomycetota bacterium]